MGYICLPITQYLIFILNLDLKELRNGSILKHFQGTIQNFMDNSGK